ncbi:UDP-N-acetylmuramoyl-L-alanine--D-glutamate ligase [Spirulina sp. 06S082]|uniref:UDP-N-acetylmuramoyl-L-alanine--D-glutamate ligase n=1 Tax=Spirulina sp. 06S082 TaxID=3110248 RepID=UPI002B3B0D52|nr:UDP-N-acetylmuramoyl-L-alanine--D-glutamate ligase [Spirulina sp. 06S082]
MKAHIIGLGRSGIAAAHLLKQQGWEVELGDRGTSPDLQSLQETLEKEGITVKLGYTLTLDHPPDLIVVSPGVPWDTPMLVEAREKAIDTIGEMELAWRFLKTSPWVGITGTNGKTTTTALIAAIFKEAGLNAPACGNIGRAACELGLKEKQTLNPNAYDWIIAEISSYQIESSREIAPKIGIWTTFTPDHLARHYTLDNYYQIKASLLNRSQQQIFNGDDPYLRNVGLEDWKNAYWTSVLGKEKLLCDRDRGIYIEEGWIVAFQEQIAPINSLKMLGDHNLQNLLLAVGAARLAGIEKEAIATAIAQFPGVSHRLESICTHANVTFINDSKATNYDAAEVGLNAVPDETILIAGGEAKTGDDTAWIEAIKRKAKAVLLIGDAASIFSQRLQENNYEAGEIVETMDKAVMRGFELAKQHNISTVLLSPACASFDQYQSFEHRGDHFRELCLAMQSDRANIVKLNII